MKYDEFYTPMIFCQHNDTNISDSLHVGIKIVAYSPLGRGFLTGTIRNRDADCMDSTDFRLKGNNKEDDKIVFQ